MRKHQDPLTLLTVVIDRVLRSLRGIYEFSSDPDCIYRLSIGGAPRDATLPDGTRFHKGEPVGILHLYNDHMPVIPASGVSLAWASTMVRRLEKSACLLAQHAASDRSLQSIAAFGNEAFLHTRANARLLERMGYAVQDAVPANSFCRRVRMQTICLWTWLLRRAFNRPSAAIPLADLQYRSIWISRRALLEKYGSRRVPSSA